jgi:AcrR family transcriptional regulator
MDVSDLFARTEEPSELTPERRILVATLDSIADFGLDAATVRVIATRAQLNPAAVNYYYRSKERLVEEALRGAWMHVSQDIDRVMREAASPGDGLLVAMRYLIEGVYRYPRLIRAIMVEHPKLRLEAASFFRTLFSGLATTSGSSNRTGLGSTLLIAFAVLFGFAPDAVALLTGLDLADAEERGALADNLASMLYGTGPQPKE